MNPLAAYADGPRRKRTLSWGRSTDDLASTLARKYGVTVSKLIESLVIIEKSRAAEPKQHAVE